MKNINLDKILRIAIWAVICYELFNHNMLNAIFACCILILNKDEHETP
jgi:hypothetical protein